jgi:hypothetical protein
MAISSTHYQLLKSIRHILPQGGSLLEIGEANWYGDAEIDFPCSDTSSLFAIARAAYAALFAPSRIVAIDFNGSPAALRIDLNCGPHDKGQKFCLELCDQFDLVYNHGTAEHIFNIAQVFRTMHDRCINGGLMIHEAPFTGWIDHGFYCLHPTLFYDLAAVNCYEIVLAAIESIDSKTIIRLEGRDHVGDLARDGKLPNNAMLYVVYRKRGDMAFRVPMQGYYGGQLSERGNRAWEELR